jgi:hypothetical protein
MYTITPPEGSPLPSLVEVSLEEVRTYVIGFHEHALWKEKMRTANEDQIVEVLLANGFDVIKE